MANTFRNGMSSSGWSMPIDPISDQSQQRTFGFNPRMGAFGAGIGGALGGMFGKNPADAASPYMDQAGDHIRDYYNQATGYLNPYNDAGKGALDQYSNMVAPMANPQEFYNNMMSGFQLSPAQKFAQQQGLDAISNNMAMRGLSGSGSMAKALEDYAQNNTAQAQQQYFNNLSGIYNQGLQGYGNLMNQGFNAGALNSQHAMNAGRSEAELAQARAMMSANSARGNSEGLGLLGGAIGALSGFF